MKHQVHKRKFLQHALSRYVYNRSLFDIFTQVEMTEEEFLQGYATTFIWYHTNAQSLVNKLWSSMV